jgi:hypothetical protein
MSARDQVLALRKRIGESFIGQEHIIERLLIGVLSNGNLLVEGCPDWRDARGRPFSSLLWNARRTLLERSRVHAGAGAAPLPPLNPTDHESRVHP